jgi:hypothetical protein
MSLRSLARVAGVLLLCLAVCAAASAQYGGGGGTGGTGGMGTGGSTGSSGYGSGSGKAIGIGVGVAAAAAVGVALLIHHRHAANRSEASVVGCTQSVMNGISLKNEKDDQTYRILSPSTALQPGERVELKGVVANQGSATHIFRVESLVNNYGKCGAASAVVAKSGGEKNELPLAAQD